MIYNTRTLIIRYSTEMKKMVHVHVCTVCNLNTEYRLKQLIRNKERRSKVIKLFYIGMAINITGVGYYMFLRQQLIWCQSVNEDNTKSQVTCNHYLTVYLDPQTIANPKVWNNNS